MNDLIKPAAITDGTLNLEIEGSFDAVTANALLRAGGLDIDGSLAAQEVTGTFTSELNLNSLTDVPVTGSAALIGLSKLPPEAESLVGDNLDVDLNLTYGVEAEKLTINSLRLLGKHVSANGNGEVNVADLSAAATLTLALDDLARSCRQRANWSQTSPFKARMLAVKSPALLKRGPSNLIWGMPTSTPSSERNLH